MTRRAFLRAAAVMVGGAVLPLSSSWVGAALDAVPDPAPGRLASRVLRVRVSFGTAASAPVVVWLLVNGERRVRVDVPPGSRSIRVESDAALRSGDVLGVEFEYPRDAVVPPRDATVHVDAAEQSDFYSVDVEVGEAHRSPRPRVVS